MIKPGINPGAPAARRPILLGIGLAVLAFALFTTMDTVIKWLSGGYSLPQIMVVNSIGGLVPVLALVAWRGDWTVLRTRRLGLHLLRGSIAIGGGFAGFFAFTRMPLADAYAIIFSAPLLITALSVPILGERVGWRRWVAVAVGFTGVLVMLRPGQGVIDIGALGAIGAALAFSTGMLMVRRMSATETSCAFAFYSNLAGIALGALFTPLSFAVPSLTDLALNLGAGMIGGTALVCIMTAYCQASPAILAPFQYTQMIWGVLYGLLIFGDQPDLWLAVGGGIVIASGLYILHRETRQPQPSEVVEAVPVA